jgi:hypothetical protein
MKADALLCSLVAEFLNAFHTVAAGDYPRCLNPLDSYQSLLFVHLNLRLLAVPHPESFKESSDR